jgi:dienelactone hydrolase
VLILVGAAIAVAVQLVNQGTAHGRRGETPRSSAAAELRSAPSAGPPTAPSPPPAAPWAVGLRVLRLVDHSRTIALPDGTTEPRTLVTEVFYPAEGGAGQRAVPDAPPAVSNGPFPLIVFGHGFEVTPQLYVRLLRAWARAGFVVAAPVFPRENADAPGGPDESDLVNQPADVSFVISRLLALSEVGSGPLAGLIDTSQIAVAGQSDGGDTALAVAYDGPYRDRRVSAAIILSGAEIPFLPSFTFPRGGPPLLATQGTSDTINAPSATYSYFAAAQRPKFLLRLIGASHLPPYSSEQPQLGIVQRVTIAFLNDYLRHRHGALKRLIRLGNVPGSASLQAEP